MSVQHIIKKSLEEYDATQPVIRFLRKNTDLEGFKTTNDTERSRFKFIDKEGNVVLDTEVEILAMFYDKFNVWSWAWSQTGILNSENFLAKEILSYAVKLGTDLTYIKSILTTSRGVIKDITQIDINLAISSSIIKQSYIYPFIHRVNDYNLIYYFILLNKNDLDELRQKIKNSKNKTDE